MTKSNYIWICVPLITINPWYMIPIKLYMCSKCVYHSRMFIVQLQDHAVSVYNPFLNFTLWTKENYRFVCYEICCSTLPVYDIDVKLLSLLSSGRDIFYYTWDLIFYLRPVTYNYEDGFLQEESKDNMQHVTIDLF